MNNLISPQTLRRCLLAALLLAATAFSLTTAAPVTFASPAGNCTFYNNASHSTVVGEHGKDCCNNPVSWGTTSSFYTCGGCFICFPPPPR
ncbi:MAG TPA: hypothetical protein VGS07_29515 [Thermoanaerobaculia bacterium]|jgi:hypothetical protein|nr:hypothetical protein [Thermoanaerobaculia bacterium]